VAVHVLAECPVVRGSPPKMEPGFWKNSRSRRRMTSPL